MIQREHLTCRDFVAVIMAYLDGELDVGQRARFEAHLVACPDCDRYLDSYRTTIALGKCICEGDDGPVPADVPEDLVQAVLAALRRR